MAAESIVAKRYARALITLLGENQQQEGQKHLMALSFVRNLFALDQARKILISPVMPKELKKQLLDYALDIGKAEPLVRHFLYEVLDAKRVALIPDMITSYETMLNELGGRIRAVVTTAVEMAAEEKEAVRVSLQEALKKKVDLRSEVDPKILGGLVIRIGHTVIDQSIKTKLNALTTSAAL